ncbi:hypothetical protein [Microbacterium sp. MYb64]|uniref:hypothetical protein n=1 Tax=Microbacterium sp. MYb64 TaxID=1848691 RepID=UPI0015E30A53|nr:hypothetical protein [Microbacterium sp. MYb64]
MRQLSEWFSFNGSVSVPVTWQGWATLGIAIAAVAGAASLCVLLAGGSVFH